MRSRREIFIAAIAIGVASTIAACSSSGSSDPTTPASAASPIADRECPKSSPLTYESFGAPFFLDYCTGCHSSKVAEADRRGAPVGIDFDSLGGIRSKLTMIYGRAADDHTTMPPAGGPSADTRKLLGDWLACGAPGVEEGFNATPLPPKQALPASCDKSPTSLPANLPPHCSAATWYCIASCAVTDVGCTGRCLKADTTPKDPTYGLDCNSCTSYQEYTCSDANGCHEVNAELLCCQQQKCPNGLDQDCYMNKCAGEAYAFSYCLSAVTPTCAKYDVGPARSCFPADLGPPPDAGADGG
jgi:hypothetical protein